MRYNNSVIMLIVFSFLLFSGLLYTQSNLLGKNNKLYGNQFRLLNDSKDIPDDIYVDWTIKNIRSQIWSGAWNDSSLTTYKYNQDGQISEVLHQKKKNDEWVNFTKITNEYTDGKKSREIIREWIDGEWQNSKRIIYSYKNMERIVEKKIENWENGKWSGLQKELYYYGDDSQKDSLIIRIMSADTWINAFKSEYKYDQKGNRIYKVDKFWQTNKWIKASELFISYNEQNKKIETLEKKWVMGTPVDSVRSLFKYNEFDSLSKKITKKPENGVWQDSARVIHEYIDQKYKKSVVRDIYTENQNWIGQDSTDYNYYQSEKKVEIVNYLRGQNSWRNNIKWIMQYSDTTSKIEEKGYAQKYKLYQAYPNPFNEATIIKYYLPRESEVLINIYNVVGQKVKTLVDHSEKSGLHTITWQPENLSSGIYYYKIKAGKFNTVKKCVYLK